MDGNFVAYYRVSTERQGASGLGLEAQRKAVTDYLNGGNWKLLDAFTEVESGKLDDRPQLEKAVKLCRRHKAKLIIAKLDRLSRKVSFVSALMDSKVEFICCDNPHATKLTIHILAAVAEHEREMISKRTKAALQAAKARGVQLGRHAAVLAPINHEAAVARAEALKPVFSDMLSRGLTVRAMVAELNERGIETPKGAQWHIPTVVRVLKRMH
jgi:DNA invertase Pin-like site-specific DNA recombinase